MRRATLRRSARSLTQSLAALALCAAPAACGAEPAQNQSSPVQSSAPALSDLEQAIVAAAKAGEADAFALLEKVVNINSGTMNLDGVRETGAVFADAFEANGLETEWIDQVAVERAGHLVARTPAPRDGAASPRGLKLLLIGHLDTVFEADSPFQRYARDGDVVVGPGVSDMKGGNVVIVAALKALREAGALDGVDVAVILTGDEEFSGRPLSVARATLIDAAKNADVALNFEGGEPGVGVTGRRSSSRWRLTTTGVRRHSSAIFADDVGAGAVYEAARILSGFYETLSTEEYLTFNPGVVVGGTDVKYDPQTNRGAAFGKTNVVAQRVTVDGDLRTISREQTEGVRERMQAIVDDHLPYTDAKIEFEDSYPPMTPTPGNAALLEIYSDLSQALGQGAVVANDPAKRGAADISFAAPHVLAAMDGLGVVGSGAHTTDETMQAASLNEATVRAALLIHRLQSTPRKHFE